MMRWRSALLWLGLVGAFSPVVVDLLRHCVAEPWSRYALVFVPMLAVCIRQSQADARASAIASAASQDSSSQAKSTVTV